MGRSLSAPLLVAPPVAASSSAFDCCMKPLLNTVLINVDIGVHAVNQPCQKQKTQQTAVLYHRSNTSCPLNVAAVTGTRLVHCVLLPSRVADSYHSLHWGHHGIHAWTHVKYFSSGRVSCHRRFVCKPHRLPFDMLCCTLSVFPEVTERTRGTRKSEFQK